MPSGVIRRTSLAFASVRYRLPQGSATTLRRSSAEPVNAICVARQPFPLASVDPVHAVFAFEADAPPAIVLTVKGSAIGAADNGYTVGGFTVILTEDEGEDAKFVVPV